MMEVTELTPFNSPLETGIRALVLLDAAYPRPLDLSTLVLFDHLVVHTADIGGPRSLHPDLPHRSGELLVRQKLIEKGVSLMRLKHLIVLELCPNGFVYRASEDAGAIVELLRSHYIQQLRARAKWLMEHYSSASRSELLDLIGEKIGRWKIEFQETDLLVHTR